MAVQQMATGPVPRQHEQQPQGVKETGEVAWMPLNSDWPTWLQQLSRAVQEAQNCYTELGEARTSCIPVIQQGGLRELQSQAHQLWQSLERYVGPLIQAWEGEVQG